MKTCEFSLPHCGCYFPNWAQFRKGKARFTAENIDPSLCSFIIVAFGRILENKLCIGEPNDLQTFKILHNFRKRNPTLKILLAVGGWTLSNQVTKVAATQLSRKNFVQSVVENLRKWNLDGIDIDWEFPKPENKVQLSALLTELRVAFEAEETERHQERLALTMAVQNLSHGGYDPAVIERTCDIVNIMAYDMHGAWNQTRLGHHAPLFNGPFCEKSTNNMEDLVLSWIEAGISRGKVCVGIPAYGRGWNISSHKSCIPGGDGNGPVRKSTYCGEMGNWPYFEIMERSRLDKSPIFHDKITHNAYCVGKDYWISFDSVESVKAKASWIQSQKLGGAFVWEISQDDFLGESGQRKFPLMNTIHQVLNGKIAASVPTPLTSTTAIESKECNIVKPGDTAYNIALKHGLTLSQLKELNPGRGSIEMIHPGDKIIVSTTVDRILDSSSSSASSSASVVTESTEKSNLYVVKSGDTAYNIALKYGLTLDQLRKLNSGRGSMEMIHPGDKIVISSGTEVTAPPAKLGKFSGTTNLVGFSGSVYTVSSGDTAYEIALKHGLTLAELRTLNPSKGSMEMIHPGDKLVVSRDAKSGSQNRTTSAADNLVSAVYTVVAGDTAYNIAMQRGITLDQLRRFNPGKGTMEMIYPGDQLNLH